MHVLQVTAARADSLDDLARQLASDDVGRQAPATTSYSQVLYDLIRQDSRSPSNPPGALSAKVWKSLEPLRASVALVGQSLHVESVRPNLTHLALLVRDLERSVAFY